MTAKRNVWGGGHGAELSVSSEANAALSLGGTAAAHFGQVAVNVLDLDLDSSLREFQSTAFTFPLWPPVFCVVPHPWVPSVPSFLYVKLGCLSDRTHLHFISVGKQVL